MSGPRSAGEMEGPALVVDEPGEVGGGALPSGGGIADGGGASVSSGWASGRLGRRVESTTAEHLRQRAAQHQQVQLVVPGSVGRPAASGAACASTSYCGRGLWRFVGVRFLSTLGASSSGASGGLG